MVAILSRQGAICGRNATRGVTQALGWHAQGCSVVVLVRRRLHTPRFSSTLRTDEAPLSKQMVSEQVARKHNLPLFRMQADQTALIEHPERFYKELLGIISRARRRIFLASLYIGHTEHDLITRLAEALDAHASLRVTILVDGLRSTREGAYDSTKPRSASCASLLAGLQSRYPDRVEIRGYRAPDLPAWLERLVGKRFVEGWGLQHMKIYGGDDEVMISGANLSNDYFTNRRDRYLVMRDAAIAQYMHDLMMTASRFAYSLQSTAPQDDAQHAPYLLTWDEGSRLPAGAVQQGRPTGPFEWKQAMHDDVTSLTAAWNKSTTEEKRQPPTSTAESVDVVPMLQMGPMRIQHETNCVPMVLSAAADRDCRLDFTTGYFSLNPLYAQSILDGAFHSSMITAAPRANGFFGSKGVSRHLPAAYTWLERRFYRMLVSRGRQNQVTIREWSKKGWTYHAKGIWLYPPDHTIPTVTLLGSSNFGIRSASLDLECTLLVDASHSRTLQQRLGEEITELHRDGRDEVGEALFARPERSVHWGVKVAAWCIRKML